MKRRREEDNGLFTLVKKETLNPEENYIKNHED